MGWFGGRSDSVETVEGAQEVVSRVSSDLAKKKDTVKSLRGAGVAKGHDAVDACVSAQAEDR